MSRTVNLGKVVPQKGIDYWTETEQNEIISTATTNVENNFAPTIATIQSNSNNALNTANTANSTANTAKSIAEGANQALSYANYQAMITAFNSLADDVYRIGQNVMIVTLNVPDLWISEIEQTSEAYTYTTDEAFTTLLQTNGYVKVGYYRLSPLETQKVDLTDYYTKEDTVSKISEMISVDDVQINGTSIVSDGVANVPIASQNNAGVIKVAAGYGIRMNEGFIRINEATPGLIKQGTDPDYPIVSKNQHSATFYGLAKAAGDTSQSQSSNAVGNYTEDAKVAIQKMLGVSEEFELINVVSIDADAERIVCNVDMSGQQFSLKAAAVIIYVEPGSEQTGNANLTVGFSPIYNQFSSNFEQLSISAGIRITPQKNFGWAKVEGIIPEIRTDSIDGTSGYITMLECGTFATSEVKRCANETNNANANGYIQTVYVNGKTFGAGSFIRVWGIRA